MIILIVRCLSLNFISTQQIGLKIYNLSNKIRVRLSINLEKLCETC